MRFDRRSGLRLPLVDTDLERRRARLRELGIGTRPDEEFDRFAAALAQAAGAPYAMVNFITGQQYFAGLYSTSDPQYHRVSERTMALDHGWCPDVLHRTMPLTLPDVMASAHFASNPVVDKLGIRTYVGAPLLDPESGTTLGTVCFISPEPRDRSEGDALYALITAHRDALMNSILRRPRLSP
ncbi:GAF domain-containing protein [Streptomyces sp. NPDC001787]|uniref:GAF domain-containing protein n=1 Tax=Streptomyces sp. NPDC001787 TaxID=3154523 RepID=UPI003332C912